MPHCPSCHDHNLTSVRSSTTGTQASLTAHVTAATDNHKSHLGVAQCACLGSCCIHRPTKTTSSGRACDAGAAYLLLRDAAPPQSDPGPPRKGTMKGSSLCGGSSWADMRGPTGAEDPSPLPSRPFGLSGAMWRCSLARDTGWSHRLGSTATPAESRWAASRSYCVLYGANCRHVCRHACVAGTSFCCCHN